MAIGSVAALMGLDEAVEEGVETWPNGRSFPQIIRNITATALPMAGNERRPGAPRGGKASKLWRAPTSSPKSPAKLAPLSTPNAATFRASLASTASSTATTAPRNGMPR